MKNDLNENEKNTLDYYNTNAASWFDNLISKDGILFEKQLIHFSELIPHGKLLEIGSGAGSDGNWFISKDYDYIGVDSSQEMVNLSKKRFPNGNFKVMHSNDLKFKDKTFDGFWTSLTLLHIPKEKIKGALKEIHRVIKSGGIGFISIKEGLGEKFEKEKERFYAYYTKEEFENILNECGLSVIEHQKETLGKTIFLLFFVKKLNT